MNTIIKMRQLLVSTILGASALAASAISTPINTMVDLNGGSQSLEDKDAAVFGNDGGIRNGTLTVEFAKDKWCTFSGKTFTVGQGGVLVIDRNISGNKNGQLNIKDGSVLNINGGIVTNLCDRSSNTEANKIGSDSATTGTMRITDGGKFVSAFLPVRFGVTAGSTGILSIDGGSFEVLNGKSLRVAYGNEATGILAVTNGVINASEIQICESAAGGLAQLTFVDSTLNIGKIYRTKAPAAGSFCLFDGATINSANVNPIDTLGNMSYVLQGNGVAVNASVDCSCTGYYAGFGDAPFIKTGSTTMVHHGNFRNAKGVTGGTNVTNFAALGGELHFAIAPEEYPAALPETSTLKLTVRNGGVISGAVKMTDAVNSLTVGGGCVIPIAFDDNGCTQIQATTLVLDTTSADPVLLDCSGNFKNGTEYLVRANITESEAAKFAVKSGSTLDAKLVWRDNNLYAEPKSRANDTVVWNGDAGMRWFEVVDPWMLDDMFTKFLNGDTAVFKNGDTSVVLDKDVQAAGLYVSNNVSVTAEAARTLTTPIIDVDAEKTLTLSQNAKLGDDFTKTGAGTLVITNYTQKKSVDLREGSLTLGWTDAPSVNPFAVAGNTISGVLDLGGATQDFAVGAKDAIFGDGGVISNGTANLTFSEWWRMSGKTFTVGPGGKLVTVENSENPGEGNFEKGGTLIIDGGEVDYNNHRGAGFYLGNEVNGSDGYAGKLVIKNGGKFVNAYQYMRIGYNSGNVGILSIDDGTLTLPTNQRLIFSGSGGSTAIVGITNATVTAYAIRFNEGETKGTTKVSIKDSVLNLVYMHRTSIPLEGSYINFDGVTFNTLSDLQTSGFMENIGIPYHLEGKGITINVTNNNVRVDGPYDGTGPLIKTGDKPLTLNGDYASTGAIEVREGALIISSSATLTNNPVFKVSDGAKLVVPFGTEGFDKTANATLQLDPDTQGKVTIELTGGKPSVDTYYPLFATGITQETLGRITVEPAAFSLSLENGQLKAMLNPQNLSWVGEGADNNWSTENNWNGMERAMDNYDRVTFSGAGDSTVMDGPDGVNLAQITVSSGAWTTDVQTASFATSPITVSSGAEFTLANATAITNPFSTANGANIISGLLDLGGAKQTFTTGMASNKGLFRSGGEIRNGNITILTETWFRIDGVNDFTIGTNATVTIGANASGTPYTSSRGEINLYNTHLIIDGGTLNELNNREGGGTGYPGYIGNGDGDAVLEVLNGGTYNQPNLHLVIGSGNDGTGAGIVRAQNGTVSLEGRHVYLGHGATNPVGAELRLTNSVLKCDSVCFGYDNKTSSPGAQTFEAVDGSTVKFKRFRSLKTGSSASVYLDGATLVDIGSDSITFMPEIDVPYTVGPNGLRIEVGDGAAKTNTISGTFAGTGPVTLAKAGDDPKLLKVSSTVFPGDVTVEDGVRLLYESPDDSHSAVTVLKAKGEITIPASWKYKDPQGRRFFTVPASDGNHLCFGKPMGMLTIIR